MFSVIAKHTFIRVVRSCACAKQVDGAIQQMDAGIDLDDVLDEIAEAGSDESKLAAAYQKLEACCSGRSTQAGV